MAGSRALTLPWHVPPKPADLPLAIPPRPPGVGRIAQVPQADPLGTLAFRHLDFCVFQTIFHKRKHYMFQIAAYSQVWTAWLP